MKPAKKAITNAVNFVIEKYNKDLTATKWRESWLARIKRFLLERKIRKLEKKMGKK